MGLFSNFVDRVMKKKLDDVAARAERAGQAGVRRARELVPVRTGRLYRSIGYTWAQSSMTLTLYADEPYAAIIERRKPYLRPGMAMAGAVLRGGNVEGQFATVGEKYQDATRAHFAGASKHRVVIGHRRRKR